MMLLFDIVPEPENALFLHPLALGHFANRMTIIHLDVRLRYRPNGQITKLRWQIKQSMVQPCKAPNEFIEWVLRCRFEFHSIDDVYSTWLRIHLDCMGCMLFGGVYRIRHDVKSKRWRKWRIRIVSFMLGCECECALFSVLLVQRQTGIFVLECIRKFAARYGKIVCGWETNDISPNTKYKKKNKNMRNKRDKIIFIFGLFLQQSYISRSSTSRF